MHSRSIQLQCYERDKAGNPILRKGEPIPTWVLPVGRHFAKAEYPLCHEQGLWREVAALVCLDAMGLSRPTRKARTLSKSSHVEHLRVIIEAQNFLRYEAECAQLVFTAAGLNADDLLRDVLKAINERDVCNG